MEVEKKESRGKKSEINNNPVSEQDFVKESAKQKKEEWGEIPKYKKIPVKESVVNKVYRNDAIDFKKIGIFDLFRLPKLKFFRHISVSEKITVDKIDPKASFLNILARLFYVKGEGFDLDYVLCVSDGFDIFYNRYFSSPQKETLKLKIEKQITNLSKIEFGGNIGRNLERILDVMFDSHKYRSLFESISKKAHFNYKSDILVDNTKKYISLIKFLKNIQTHPQDLHMFLKPLNDAYELLFYINNNKLGKSIKNFKVIDFSPYVKEGWFMDDYNNGEYRKLVHSEIESILYSKQLNKKIDSIGASTYPCSLCSAILDLEGIKFSPYTIKEEKASVPFWRIPKSFLDKYKFESAIRDSLKKMFNLMNKKISETPAIKLLFDSFKNPDSQLEHKTETAGFKNLILEAVKITKEEDLPDLVQSIKNINSAKFLDELQNFAAFKQLKEASILNKLAIMRDSIKFKNYYESIESPYAEESLKALLGEDKTMEPNNIDYK